VGYDDSSCFSPDYWAFVESIFIGWFMISAEIQSFFWRKVMKNIDFPPKK
jgi:hypothetical protein